MLITILATIVVLGVLIFVHELGHFVTAKLVDIEVPRFSIGLGPKLIGFRRGETEYVISWLPLGGYVKMAGMEEMEAIEGGPVKREEGTGIAGASDMGLLRRSKVLICHAQELVVIDVRGLPRTLSIRRSLHSMPAQ